MYFPSYDLLVESRACNNALYVDIVGLGKSVKDGTMAVPHGVLGPEDATYLDSTIDGLPVLPRAWTSYFKIDRVSSPENLNITRTWRVELITVPQKYSSKLKTEDKGKQEFNRTRLSQSAFYGSRRSSKHGARNVDITIIIGDCEQDGNQHMKLLLLRFHSIITSTISSSDATSLYNHIRSVCGKSGYEMTRVSGSSGCVTPQSDIDFLVALNEIETALPRKCGACKIMRGKRHYVIAYMKHKTNDDESDIAIFKYGVPKEGGSFECTSRALVKFPLLSEFTYCKMVATMIIHKWNCDRFMDGLLPIAEGAVEHEMTNIHYSRTVATSLANGNDFNYLFFLKEYCILNCFSMNAHNAGLHLDYFGTKECLENKMLIINPERNDSIGRGGALFDDSSIGKFVYVILDWGYEKRRERAWFEENARHYGLDPTMRFRQKTIDQYFDSDRTRRRFHRDFANFKTHLRRNDATSTITEATSTNQIASSTSDQNDLIQATEQYMTGSLRRTERNFSREMVLEHRRYIQSQQNRSNST
jgi:hypothetical protein